jgi:hypothetical protein
MNSNGALCWLAASVLSFSVLSEPSAATSGDPVEIDAGAIRVADTPASQAEALELLGRARGNYALRAAGRGYDLKVSFTVNSGGQTLYDGAWQMEDIFDPQQGLHWTATNGTAYRIAEISSKGNFYSAGTEGHIPLRLQEARAALLDAIPSAADLNGAAVRTATATFRGKSVTCVLFSAARTTTAAEQGRRWNETEDCIDPQSEMLMLHSQVPGRYYAYDYSNAPQFGGRFFPHGVTVIEAGRTVSQISVDSLTELRSADQSLFVPTSAMLERGRATAMSGAQKIARVVGEGQASGAPVCVFGVVNASGKLVEAHSLQPDDPNSEAAVNAAGEMNFLRPTPGMVGPPPQQHFAFVFVRFASQSR